MFSLVSWLHLLRVDNDGMFPILRGSSVRRIWKKSKQKLFLLLYNRYIKIRAELNAKGICAA